MPVTRPIRMKRLRLPVPLVASLLLTSSAFGLRAASAPAQVDGFAFVKTLGGISEYTLESNGLDVLLLPDHSAPVLTFMVT